MKSDEKPNPPKDIRTPFYKASDGIYALFDTIRTIKGQDQSLIDQASVLVIELNKLQEQLNEKYRWD